MPFYLYITHTLSLKDLATAYFFASNFDDVLLCIVFCHFLKSSDF